MIYDCLAVFSVLFVATSIVVIVHRGVAIAPGSALFTLFLCTCGFLYFAVSWTRGGQTLGMRAWRIEIYPYPHGDRVAWRQATLRFCVAILSLAAGGLGFFWSLADEQRRTWHDIASATRLRRGSR